MSTPPTDRELRDRLEALEAEVKRLTQAQALLQHVVLGANGQQPPFETWEMRAPSWLGRHDAIALAPTLFVLGLLVFLVAADGASSLWAVAYFLLWSQMIGFGMKVGFRSALALNAIYARVRR